MYQNFKVIVVHTAMAQMAVHFTHLVEKRRHDHTKIEYADRGLQYGDGCFTTMYCEGRQITLFEEHTQRLISDALRLKMIIEPERLQHEVSQVLKTFLCHNTESLAIKLLMTRGIGGRGYDIPKTPMLHLYISFHLCEKFDYDNFVFGKLTDYRVRPCSFALGSQPLLAGIKHLNRIEQVLAKHEIKTLSNSENLLHDLVMLDQQENVVECSAGNLFFYAKQTWHTPDLRNAGVNGVMRGAIIRYMQANDVSLKIAQYCLADLMNAESMFVCNAIKHIVAVSELMYPRQKEFEIKPLGNRELRLFAPKFRQDLVKKHTVFEEGF